MPRPARRDPKAVAIVEAVAKTVDPEGVWGKVSALRFFYGASVGGGPASLFKHTWDVRSGRYRVEGKDSEGNEKIAMFQLGATTGEGWARLKFTQPLPDNAEAPWVRPPGIVQDRYLELAYQRFRNDTTQLLLPFKLQENIVGLSYEGPRELEGTKYDVVKAVLPPIGLVPEETYWVYVNPATHLIDRTESLVHDKDILAAFDRQEDRPTGSRISWVWKDWRTIGSFRLSVERKSPDGKDLMRFTDFEVLPEIPASAWEKPHSLKMKAVGGK